MKDNAVFPTRKVSSSDKFSIVSNKQEMCHVCKETRQRRYLIHTGSDNVFKGTVVNRTISAFLHREGYLKLRIQSL